MATLPTIPGYMLTKSLGQGRITENFLAIKKGSNQEVVIKILLPELVQGDHFDEIFLKVTKQVAQLEHPNIAPIIDIDETEYHMYYVVEYFPDSLRERIVHKGITSGLKLDIGDYSEEEETADESPDPREILDIFKQVSDALTYAHSKGFIHKDIRPDNIFFRADGTPLITDFNIATLVEISTVLKNNNVPAIPAHYQSPEGVLRQPLDHLCDFYSLGVTLYEYLTGYPPYSGDEPLQIQNMHITQPIPPLPEDVALFKELVETMMSKKKANRLKDASQFRTMASQLSKSLPPSRPKIKPQSAPPPSQAGTLYNAPNTAETGEGDEIPNIHIEDDGESEETLEHTDNAGPIAEEEPEEWPSKPRNVRFERKYLGFIDADMVEEWIDRLKEDTRLQILSGILLLLVIAIPIFFLIKSCGSSETEQSQSQQQPITEEDKQRYDNKLAMAKKSHKEGDIDRMRLQLEQAEKIMITPETKKLRTELEKCLAQQTDHNAFQKAVETATSEAYQEYLKNFPSGLHVAEIQTKITELEAAIAKQLEEDKIWEKRRIQLRSTYTTLSPNAIKAMLIKRNFFEKYYNETGNFTNSYVLKVTNKQRVVFDRATGLMWHGLGSPAEMKLDAAKEWIAKLNTEKYGGFDDWRLPSLEEAASILENKESIYNVYLDAVFTRDIKSTWTGDSFNTDKIWVIDFFSGDFNAISAIYESFVLPVRSVTP